MAQPIVLFSREGVDSIRSQYPELSELSGEMSAESVVAVFKKHGYKAGIDCSGQATCVVASWGRWEVMDPIGSEEWIEYRLFAYK